MAKISKNIIKKAIFVNFLTKLPVVFNYKQQAIKAASIGISIPLFKKEITSSGNYVLLIKGYYCKKDDVNTNASLAVKEYIDTYAQKHKTTKDIWADITTVCILHKVIVDDFIRDLELIQIQE
jgi:hypothetical protein